MRKYQQGLSYWSVMFGICFLAFVIKLTATVGGIYLDYYTLDKMLQAKFRETQVDKLEIKQFIKDFEAQMERNGVRDRKVEDLMVVKREGNLLIIELDYEERKNFAANLDIVVHFKKNYSTAKPDGYVE
jgi:hypothetical protein